MKQRTKWIISASFFFAFVLWTVLVKTIDVKSIGPNESEVGFAAMNEAFHSLTGVNLKLYVVVDWLTVVPFVVCALFGLVGFVQLVKRKNLFAVDADILALGLHYIVVICAYLLFEIVKINFRPVFINGVLETSYPSSTTLVVLCVAATAIYEVRTRIKGVALKETLTWASAAFAAFMLVGRILSGVHWLSDIIGGIILTFAFVIGFFALKDLLTTILSKRSDDEERE